MEPTEKTLTGNTLKLVIGILAFAALLISIGVCVPTTRAYIDTAVKTTLGAISIVTAK
jgi:hypothetical protein